jgi:hypothetical protein
MQMEYLAHGRFSMPSLTSIVSMYVYLPSLSLSGIWKQAQPHDQLSLSLSRLGSESICLGRWVRYRVGTRRNCRYLTGQNDEPGVHDIIFLSETNRGWSQNTFLLGVELPIPSEGCIKSRCLFHLQLSATVQRK